MRKSILPQTQTAPAQASHAKAAATALSAAPGSRCLFPFPSCAIMAAFMSLVASAALLGAQTPAAQPPTLQTASTQNPIHTHKRPSAARAAVVPAPAAPADPAPDAAAAPPVPETPKWPANDQPAPASVVWNGEGLRIDASNSSLQQILNDVSTATGAKVEGLSSDQRVFGAYGPGRARDVLSQLLQGSGYNVIMIGDQGRGTPRQILLSTRAAGNTQSIAKSAPTNNSDDDDADDQPPPEPAPVPIHPGFPPRSPQQIMQEMQQRQQQMQQQQQQPQPQPQN